MANRPEHDDVGLRVALGVADHAADAGHAVDGLGGDDRGVRDADREPDAGEDLRQRVGQHHVADHRQRAGAQRAGRLDQAGRGAE